MNNNDKIINTNNNKSKITKSKENNKITYSNNNNKITNNKDNNNTNKNNNKINNSIRNISNINKNNQVLKIADGLFYNNNVIVDINNKEKVNKTIFCSSLERLENFKKNLLDTVPKIDCQLCHRPIYSHLYKIHYNSHATEVFKWLYLGTFDNACDINELRRIKCTHILNCAIECINKSLTKDIKELHLNIYDNDDFELFQYFEKSNEFMNKCKLEGGVVLVHCKFGISRSAAFVIAYLIEYMGYTTDSALNFLIEKRNQTRPNVGFREQLYNYEKWIKKNKK